MRQRPRPLPADERRAATVEAVVELAAEQNPGDITTAAIAQRMGLTQGALFRHFPTKDAILEAVMGWVSERLLAQLDAAAASAATPLAALEAMFMAHVGFVVRHPGRAADAVRRTAAPRRHPPQAHGADPHPGLRTAPARASGGRASRGGNWMPGWTWTPPPPCSSVPCRDW